MSELYLPNKNYKTQSFEEIKNYLNGRDIEFSRWDASIPLKTTDTQETILKAYEHELGPFMKAHGFQTADVINVHPEIPNIEALREKFLSEHTHSEDEVRFFVDGSGKFWFHFDDGEVAAITCVKDDFLAVPAGIKHWFDLAPDYFVKAIRIFSNTEGWTPQYTNSGVDRKYNV